MGSARGTGAPAEAENRPCQAQPALARASDVWEFLVSRRGNGLLLEGQPTTLAKAAVQFGAPGAKPDRGCLGDWPPNRSRVENTAILCNSLRS